MQETRYSVFDCMFSKTIYIPVLEQGNELLLSTNYEKLFCFVDQVNQIGNLWTAMGLEKQITAATKIMLNHKNYNGKWITYIKEKG